MCGGLSGCTSCGSCRSAKPRNTHGMQGMIWNPNPSPYYGTLDGTPRNQAMIDAYWAPAASSMGSLSQRSIGAIPGGWTQAEWSQLTGEQQTAVLNADAKTQSDIRASIQSGVTAAVALIRAGIDAGQQQADRDRDLELARINANRDIQIAKLKADAGQPIDTATTPVTKEGTTQGSGGVMLLLAAGVGAFFLMGKKRSRS